MLKAVIFDMDGVIIDSEPMHAEAAILALKNYKVTVSMDYIQQFIGSTALYMCQIMIEDFHIDTTPENLLRAMNEKKDFLLKKEGFTVIPYVKDLIENLFKNGIKLFIASSSPSEDIEKVMDFLEIRQYFMGYVSGSDVLLPKPAPDIFLAAAKKMDTDPQECIVIEDSFHGVTAARAAGMTCIGYANRNSGNQDLRKAAILVEGFDEIDYEFISHIYNYTHTPAVILTSEQFIIRELTVKDIPALYQICRQPGVRKFLYDYTDSLEIEQEKHKAYIQNIYRFYGFGLWGVFLKCNNRLIGRCGIEYKKFDGEEIYELGYLLDSDYQGMGYAKEFVTEVLNYCFTELDIHKVTAVIEKRNIRSIHLAEQIGMTKVSECCRDKHDCYKYEITYHH